MSDQAKQKVCETLETIALLWEILDENPFKIRAFTQASRILRELPGDFTELFQKGDLKKVKGIGKAVLSIADQVMAQKPVRELEELLKEVPAGVVDLTRLPGIGPKRARSLWQELKVTNLGELEYACKENRLESLKGFGLKMQESILASLQEVKKQAGYFRLDQIHEADQSLRPYLTSVWGDKQVFLVGDARRRTEIARSLDYLIHSTLSLLEFYQKLKELTQKNPNLAVDLKEQSCRFQGIPINVHLCPEPDLLGLHQFLFTGSIDFVKKILAYGETIQIEITQEGLYKKGLLQKTPNEQIVFDLLDLFFIEPEEREEWALLTKKAQSRPTLVKRSDLRGAFHNHTMASDGRNSLQEMRQAAIEQNLSYLSINDHSKSAFYAHGQSDEALLLQIQKITKLNTDSLSEKCWLFSGVESDILSDGSLDYEPQILKQLDVVIASVHSRMKQNASEMTQRLVAAAQNPYTTLIGHPTGRLLLSRAPYAFSMEDFLEACKQCGCALELNAHPQRLDLDETALKMAKELGVLIAINADAHHQGGLADLDYGIMIARRAGLTANDVLNCRELNDIKMWLNNKKPKKKT